MFDSVASHLKLEAGRRESEHAHRLPLSHMPVSVSPIKASVGPDLGQSQNLAPQGDKAMKRCRGKRGEKKNVAKAKCYNCEKMDHFARDCTEPKKIVDTGATKHVTRDRAGFIDYHQVSACSHYITMGNGAQKEVLGIG
ncbi:hypothetical protein Salat_1116500 [Sesamum alatum]|uniref:CCHC-type domain-containing protein n=1 Tax=Sesamum alatum TaxID=300844 RepID=A0AAE1YNZ1_9LAMI|nr:hypothetical protein Salat_1116500 [Sesamum alatum]